MLITFLFCEKEKTNNVITSDIANFWSAYDKITTTKDTILQLNYLKELFLNKGTIGLKELIKVKGYTLEEYLGAINNYPKFWNSIRKNTYKSHQISNKINDGIQKLKAIYPEMRPAKIYFTIGALRSGGTTKDSLVLISSEMAMTDENTVSSELPKESQNGRRRFFDSNPINDIVLLNVHEYVHTQQNPIVHNLLSYVLYEGIAEFVSVKAMQTKSVTPAISFGKKNEEKVKAKFEQEIFKGENTHEWLWSDAENEFGVRDLGYYIGYAICERHYTNAKNKKNAIKEMIELDFANEEEVEKFIDDTNFFSTTIEHLYQNFDKQRPVVKSINEFNNGSQNVNPNITTISITFSEKMNINTRGFDFGPLGEKNVLSVKEVIGFSDDRKTFKFKVALKPDTRYQSIVTNRFKMTNGIPLKSYLIDFKTKKD